MTWAVTYNEGYYGLDCMIIKKNSVACFFFSPLIPCFLLILKAKYDSFHFCVSIVLDYFLWMKPLYSTV